MSTHYESTADALVCRILDLIPSHPELLDMDDPWKLFKVPGFKCDDLQPTLFQADYAMRRAQTIYRSRVVG